MTHALFELHAVALSPLVIEDLVLLHGWIADESDVPTADRYRDRIDARIAALAQSPQRGTPRDDLAPELRTLVSSGA